jgi:hypothetical protein
MSTYRSDLRTRVRDYLYEAAADWFSNDQLNRLISEEILSLPSKDIYLESLYTTNLVVNQQDYTLPTGTKKIEKLQINNGTSTIPYWNDVTGYDTFNNAIYLDWIPYSTNEIRAFLRFQFTNPTGDVVALDVPDDVCEIVVWGVVIRAYKMAIGYLRNAKNWDSVAKPDYLTLNTLSNWLAEARKDYNDLVKHYMFVSRPRDINLVS